jgi:hypothetical protein
MNYLRIIFVLVHFSLLGQGRVGNLFEPLPNDSVEQASLSLHTSVLPSIRLANLSYPRKVGKGSSILIDPLCDVGFRYATMGQYRAGFGARLEGQLGAKWFFNVNVLPSVTTADSVFTPKTFYVKDGANYSTHVDLRGRIAYTPNSIFNFQVGLDHHFIGEGNRSLFLSDYGKPYPFGQVRVKFWRLEYTILYQFFREQRPTGFQRKNAASHYISFNAAKWLNIGVFESVVFQPKDTLLNRGYDVEYLNPAILYRPQEYALGSADNVLLGVSFAARIKRHTLYGQVMLDEFLLSEIKARNGWWANKYGIQLGVKGRFNYKGLTAFYRIEMNSVRPYTYSHIGLGQNYGNQGMTLAHPYGANFNEILGEIKVQKGKWLFKSFISFFIKGYDEGNGVSYGGDIYQSYNNRLNDYGNIIGQGVKNKAFRLIVTIDYQLPIKSLHAFIENQVRYDSAFGGLSYFPLVGIRSMLWNDYRNY